MALNPESDLVTKMRLAVKKEEPDRHPELERIISTYTGKQISIQELLTRMGTFNPWEAARRARLISYFIRTDQEIRDLKVKGKTTKIAESISGNETSRQNFTFANAYDPGVECHMGAQTATKIFQTFGSPDQAKAFTPEAKRKVAEKNTRSAQGALADIKRTIDDVLTEPSRITEVRSRMLRDKLQAYINLDEQLRQRMLALDRVIYGNTAMLDERQDDTYLLVTQRGGTMRRFFESRLDDLKPGIRDLYTSFMSGFVDMDETMAREATGVLLTYMARNMYVSTEAAIGGFKKDLTLVANLPEDDPVIKEHGRPRLDSIRDILGKSEITLIEAATVFEHYPIDEVRVEINKRLYEKGRPDIDTALTTTRPLFIRPDGNWHEDSLSLSVPMGRLKESRYNAILSREEWLAAMEAHRLKTLAQYKNGFFAAPNIEQFTSMAKTLRIAGLKIKALDEHLAVSSIDPSSITSKEIDELARILPGSEYEPKEEFQSRIGISIDELIDRIENHGMTRYDNRYWVMNKEKIKREAKWGLYDARHEEAITFRQLVSMVKPLEPAAAMEDDMTLARSLVDRQLAETGSRVLIFNKKYLEPSQAKRIKFIAQKARESVMELDPDARNNECILQRMQTILDKRADLESRTFYTGNLNHPDLKGGVVSSGEYMYDNEPQFMQENAKVVNLAGLESHIEQIESNYERLENQEPQWTEKAKFILSRRSQSLVQKALKLQYVSLPYTPLGTKPSMIDSKLINQVEAAYNEVQRYISHTLGVVTKGRILIEGDILLPGSYEIMITGTKREQSNQFKEFFSDFGVNTWKGSYWTTRQPIAKPHVVQAMSAVEDFNTKYKANLRLDIKAV